MDTIITNLVKGHLSVRIFLALLVTAASVRVEAQEEPTWTTKDWAALATLPDWGGIWLPDTAHQRERYLANDVPWKPEVAEVIDEMLAAKAAGRPYGLFVDCLPLGMPSWILGSHNAMEILFTPGRVTMLGELDGNRLRRIYTDGRPHSEEPDLTYHGHSIGHWEGEALVVDTIGILPEVYLSTDGENIGVRNGGEMHIRERIYLAEPDTLQFEMQITAPNILSEPWQATSFYHRLRGPHADIIEGVCLQGNWIDQVDEEGRTIFLPIPRDQR